MRCAIDNRKSRRFNERHAVWNNIGVRRTRDRVFSESAIVHARHHAVTDREASNVARDFADEAGDFQAWRKRQLRFYLVLAGRH